eukprot:gb/GFBE01069594.1/.p1 GENE.gb/GFBE01069594.1/~~gb/GFBE01069594.1/.p1  ORF type:complete len:264 (+),score=56.25 gb/GFBE01069594.1/:1-792(+)
MTATLVTKLAIGLATVQSCTAWCPLRGGMSSLLMELGAISDKGTNGTLAIGEWQPQQSLMEISAQGYLMSSAPTATAVDVASSSELMLHLAGEVRTSLGAVGAAAHVRLGSSQEESAAALQLVMRGPRDFEVLLHRSLLSNLAVADLDAAARRVAARSGVDAMELLAAGNGTLPEVLKCVLGCVVPSTIGVLIAENVAAEGFGCLVCKALKLDDTTCSTVLEGMFLVPIILMPLTAVLEFKICTPMCPWASQLPGAQPSVVHI